MFFKFLTFRNTGRYCQTSAATYTTAQALSAACLFRLPDPYSAILKEYLDLHPPLLPSNIKLVICNKRAQTTSREKTDFGRDTDRVFFKGYSFKVLFACCLDSWFAGCLEQFFTLSPWCLICVDNSEITEAKIHVTETKVALLKGGSSCDCLSIPTPTLFALRHQN